MTSPTNEAVAALSEEVFPEVTMPALVDAIWNLNILIHKTRARRNDLEAIVLRHCIKTGDVVVGKKATAEAREYLDEVVRGEPKWKTKLETRKR